MTFFNKQDEEQQDQEVQDKIKIGDNEYDPTELEAALKRAKEVEELEKKYNTKVDKVWPEYGKSQSRLKEMEEELASLKTQATQQPSEYSPDQVAQAREAAKKIGLITDDAFADTLAKHFRDLYRQEREAEKILDKGKELETKIDGSDGRPKFVLEDVLNHMAETGIKDLEKAYKDRYENELDQWKTKQLNRQKLSFVSDDSPTITNREPEPVKITDDNIDNLVMQGLRGEL
jgi:hypothetical protein